LGRSNSTFCTRQSKTYSGLLRLEAALAGEIETEAFWVAFLRSLRERGLAGVRLCVSDEHLGLKNAIARVLACPWQRCTVHYAD